jgi:hypothetical protein
METGKIEQARSFAKTLVGFLDGDNVRLNFADHVGNTIGIEFLINPDTFVDIIGSDQQIIAHDSGNASRAFITVPDRGENAGGDAGSGVPHRLLAVHRLEICRDAKNGKRMSRWS